MGCSVYVPSKYSFRPAPRAHLEKLRFYKDLEVDPKAVNRRPWVPKERYELGCDDDPMKTIEAYRFLRMYSTKASPQLFRGRHDLFEAMAHVVFPKREEKIFAYTLIWHLRDELPIQQIAALLKTTPNTASRVVKYVMRCWMGFINRSSFSRVTCREDLLEPDHAIETIAREETRSE